MEGDNIIFYEVRNKKTPYFHIKGLCIILVFMLAMIFAQEYVPLLHSENYNLTLNLVLSLVIFIGVSIYFYSKKYVNYIKINNTKKTLEIQYVKPFQSITKIAPFDNFSFYINEIPMVLNRYSTSLSTYKTKKILQINMFNDTQIRIPEIEQYEDTFSENTFENLIQTLATIKQQNVVSRRRR